MSPRLFFLVDFVVASLSLILLSSFLTCSSLLRSMISSFVAGGGTVAGGGAAASGGAVAYGGAVASGGAVTGVAAAPLGGSRCVADSPELLVSAGGEGGGGAS